MKKLTILAALLTATIQAFAGEIKITANLTGFSDTAVVYLLSGQTPIAYKTLAQGIVELTAEVSETPESYMMYIVDNNQPYFTELFVADETLQITAAKEDFPYQVKVNGSKHHFAKEKLNELQMPLHKKGEAFKQEIIALQQTPEWQKPEVQEKYVGENGLGSKLTFELKQVEADFILNNFDNAYTWTLLPYNTTAFDKTFYKAVYDKMTAEQKQTEIGKKYLLASKSQRLTKGDSFIDVAVLDKDLNAEKLSDYFAKGKDFVLVDLSSVNCPSSNQSFPITKNFADKNTDKLQVVSVLESNDAETYKHFGKLSTDNWAIVYAEDFTRTNTYIQYQENKTPTFLLFDKAGKLIDRWSGALIHQQKLEQHFSK